ncbi:MAG: hypothetical protein QM635_11795, partial [Microbacteriaceae bacterium]
MTFSDPAVPAVAPMPLDARLLPPAAAAWLTAWLLTGWPSDWPGGVAGDWPRAAAVLALGALGILAAAAAVLG